MAPREIKAKGQARDKAPAPAKSSSSKKKNGSSPAVTRAAKTRSEIAPEISVTPSPLDPSRISQRAWEIWQNEGCPEGRDVEHWLQAERELRAE